MGYSHARDSKVQAARDNELRAGLVTSWLDVIKAASGSFSNVVSPAITLGLYILFARMAGDVALDEDRLSTSFALVQMITIPATSIMLILPEFIETMAGFDRVQRFLLQLDHQDRRKLLEGVTDEKWYRRVLHVCDMELDLLSLPNGDNTVVTNGEDLLELSDLIVILNSDGSICEQGTWDEPKIQARYNKLDLQPDIDLPQDKHKRGIQQINVPRTHSSILEQSMDVLRRSAHSTIYTQYIAAIGTDRFLATIFIFLSSAASAMLVQTWFRLWVEDEEAGKRITFYIGVYFALAIGHWVSLTGIGTIEFLLVPTSGRALHNQLLTTVIKAPLSFNTSTGIGITLSRFSEDIMQIDRKLPREIAVLGSQMFKLLALIIHFSASQTYNLIALPLFVIAVYAIQDMYFVTSRRIKRHCIKTSSLSNDRFVETVQGIAIIRAYGWENAYALNNSRALNAFQVPSYTLHVLEQSLGLVLDLIVAGVVLVHVAFIVTFTGTMTAGDVGIIQSWANFDTSFNVVSRIRDFAIAVAPETQPTQEHPIPKSWPSRGKIDLCNVVVSHGDQPSASDHTTVDVSFKVAPVHKIADPFIIPNDTVRGNLDALGIATDKKIVETLKKVHLWSSLESRAIDSGLSPTFYLDVPMNAWPLSEGQLQLLPLSRALLLRSSLGKILLFEEFASNVDPETSGFVQKVIDEEFRGYTIIVVAHRLESIANSDVIIVMDKGRIVEVGAFNDLRQKQGALRSLLDSIVL
ncbi:ABC transporter transmembrane domain type 1 [Penicillium cf. griseofulvum]|uniref:ABC transporter transmembrane domain type 1 n=1 Tax=Penicillium cf. griseofulvum TaxID=2972120 RepID=A0A9W9T293_9EURO|nr:ABC transporter transmembrane domain type 1 [Penicillium cf. griseofulvum]KAJ5440348.1 ABC transporter transmembrane domain type 1 [Penicillium cf. griseofulvum]